MSQRNNTIFLLHFAQRKHILLHRPLVYGHVTEFMLPLATPFPIF